MSGRSGGSRARFIGRVNDHRRAGRPIDDAISLAQTAKPAVRRSPSENGAGRAPSTGDRSGRPRRFTPLFAWRSIADGIRVIDVDTTGLATTRLAATRSADVDAWLAAVRADVVAFRDLCAAEPDGAQAWARLLEELGPVLAAD